MAGARDRYERVGSSLVILSAHLDDGAQFRCTVNNSEGAIEITSQVTVTSPISVQVSYLTCRFLNNCVALQFLLLFEICLTVISLLTFMVEIF